MAKLQGLEDLVAKLRDLASKSKTDTRAVVAVGYTAAYALYVHENLQARHTVGKAKYLTDPAKDFAEEIAEVVRRALRKGQTMAQSLLLGGLRLQRESQKVVPVNIGNLRDSAFTRLE